MSLVKSLGPVLLFSNTEKKWRSTRVVVDINQMTNTGTLFLLLVIKSYIYRVYFYCTFYKIIQNV